MGNTEWFKLETNAFPQFINVQTVSFESCIKKIDDVNNENADNIFGIYPCLMTNNISFIASTTKQTVNVFESESDANDSKENNQSSLIVTFLIISIGLFGLCVIMLMVFLFLIIRKKKLKKNREAQDENNRGIEAVNIENNANNEQEVGEKEGMEIMNEIEGDANDMSDSKESKLSMYDVFDQINTAGNDENKSDDESLYKFKNQDQDMFGVVNTKMSEDGIDVGFDELDNPFADAEESDNN